MQSRSYVLGIDIGSSYLHATVARAAGDDEAELVPLQLGTGQERVSASVLVHPDGTAEFGDQAAQRGTATPQFLVNQIRARVGDETPILVQGQRFLPEDLYSGLVELAFDRAIEVEGGEPELTVVAVPAVWGPYRRGRALGALRAHGIENCALISDTSAVLAMASDFGAAPGKPFAVIDIGGTGQHHIIARRDSAELPDVIAEQDLGIGGSDFDDALFAYVRQQLFPGSAEPPDGSVLKELRRSCVAAKEALSTQAEVSISAGSGAGAVVIPRATFEEIISGHVHRCVVALESLIARSGLAEIGIAAVYLAGGSAEVPALKHALELALGVRVFTDTSPAQAVAAGAALDGISRVGAPQPSAEDEAAGVVAVVIVLTAQEFAFARRDESCVEATLCRIRSWVQFTCRHTDSSLTKPPPASVR